MIRIQRHQWKIEKRWLFLINNVRLENNVDLLRFSIIGSVDDGKSTLLGNFYMKLILFQTIN